MEQIDAYIDKFGLNKFGEVPIIKKASELSGLQHKHIVTGLAVIIIGCAVCSPGLWLVSAITTFLWPCYLSYKALETPNPEDDKKWLTYWVVFGFIYCFDNVFQKIFIFVPLYSIVRLIVLCCVYFVFEDGTTIFYNTVVEPIFKRLSPNVDYYVQVFEDITFMNEAPIEA